MAQTQSMIQVDPKLIDDLMKEHIAVAMTKVFSDRNDAVINTIVNQILNIQVNERGEISTASYEKKHSWIEWAINKEIRGVVLETAKGQIRAMIPEIEKAIKKEVAKSNSAIAKAIIGGFTDSLKVDYRFNVTLSTDDK